MHALNTHPGVEFPQHYEGVTTAGKLPVGDGVSFTQSDACAVASVFPSLPHLFLGCPSLRHSLQFFSSFESVGQRPSPLESDPRKAKVVRDLRSCSHLQFVLESHISFSAPALFHPSAIGEAAAEQRPQRPHEGQQAHQKDGGRGWSVPFTEFLLVYTKCRMTDHQSTT